MVVETDVEVSQQPVIRHYRGRTRAEVEQAYRSDAEQAAKSGFLPVTHQWTNDWQGLLLVVSYQGSAAPTAPQVAVMYEAPEPSAAQPPAAPQPQVATVDHFAVSRESAAQDPDTQFQPTNPAATSTTIDDQYAPLIDGSGLERYSPAPINRYSHPTYSAPAIEQSAYEPPAPHQPTYAATPIEQDIYDSLVSEPPMDETAAQEQPTYEQPTYEQPTYEQPAYVAPPPEQPAYVPPPPHQPTYDAPHTEQPWFLEPGPVAIPQPSAPELPQALEFASAPPAVPVAEPEPAPVAQPESVAQPEPVAEPTPAPVAELEPTPAPTEIDIPAPVLEPEKAHAPIGRQARLTIQTMDLHCAGEPLRIIRSGFPEVPNLPVLERRKWVMEHADHVRRAIIQEPRGHRDMYGAILLPSHTDHADMTVLFMHNEGYSTMCGHGIIAITTGLIEEGLFPAIEPVTTIRYEVPAGIVAANAATVRLDDGTWAVQGVRFTNVPSYVAAQSLAVRPDGVTLHGNAAQYGALSVDLAFGGAYYGIVNAAELGLRVVPDQAEELRHAGAAITEVLRRDHTPSHPTDAALSFVYGTIIVDLDPRSSPDGRATRAHMRNATIFADAELDRSPCGSGTSAILAQLHARGRIKVGQEIINAGITGEHFLGRIEAETALGPYPAVSTSIAGTAYLTGYSTFIVDSRDPLGEGFLLS